MNRSASPCEKVHPESPTLSICITYYEAGVFLQECLASIERCSPPTDYEVLVIDDASPRSCPAAVESTFKSVRVLRNRTNLGFAAANGVLFGFSGSRQSFPSCCDGARSRFCIRHTIQPRS